MKKLLLLSMIILFSTTVMAGPLYKSIRYDEYPQPGLNMIYFNVYNTGDEDYDDLQARIFIPGLNERFVSNEFDLDEGEHYSGVFYYYLPQNSWEGDYEIFYTVSNDEISTREYRFFTVI